MKSMKTAPLHKSNLLSPLRIRHEEPPMNQAPLAHLPSLLNIEFAQCTSAGRKPENQDSVGARFPEGAALACKGIALAIADGVSSSQAARQASQTAVTGFLSDYYATPETWRTEPVRPPRDSISQPLSVEPKSESCPAGGVFNHALFAYFQR